MTNLTFLQGSCYLVSLFFGWLKLSKLPATSVCKNVFHKDRIYVTNLRTTTSQRLNTDVYDRVGCVSIAAGNRCEFTLKNVRL